MARIQYARVIPIDDQMQPRALIAADNADYILVGRTFGRPNKAYITRQSQTGLHVWEKTLDGQFDVMLESIAQLKDGGFVAVGSYFHSVRSGDEYIWIVKLDENGEKVLEIKLGQEADQSDGNAVVATADGGFIVASTIRKSESTKEDTWIIKYNKDFEQEWERTICETMIHCVKQTKDGGYVLCGAKIVVEPHDCSVIAFRLNADGSTVWERLFEDIQTHALFHSEIIQDCDGNFVIAAKTSIWKLNADGQMIWLRTNDAFRLNAVVQMPDGSYGLGGGVTTRDNIVFAYALVIDQDGEHAIWDNSSAIADSFVSDVLVNKAGLFTCAVSIMGKTAIATFDGTAVF